MEIPQTGHLKDIRHSELRTRGKALELQREETQFRGR